MKRKVYAKAVTMCLSAAVLIGMTGVSAKAEENTITFTPVSSIKIGERLQGKFQYQNNPEGMTPVITTLKGENQNNFLYYGYGGLLPECPTNGVVTVAYGLGQAINIGAINVVCGLANNEESGYQHIATYTVEVEAPQITNNLEEVYYVNDTVDLRTKLENVVLPEGNIEELIANGNSNTTGEFTYQAQVEVAEGQDLVRKSNEDYSMALQSSETIEFLKEGTVTFKITYNPVILTAGGVPSDPWYAYDRENGVYYVKEAYRPEIYVTVQVVDAKAVLSDEINNTVNAGLEQSQYTVESWNTFDQALKNAQAVLADPDSTNEMYVQACQALKSAREGLVEVSEPTVTPEPEEPTVTPEPDENNPLTPDSVPQNPSDTDKKEDAKPVKADTVNSQSVKTQAVQTSDENNSFLPVTIAGIAMGLGIVLAYVKRRITVNR